MSAEAGRGGRRGRQGREGPPGSAGRQGGEGRSGSEGRRASERRLDQLREEASRTGRVEGDGVDVSGGPIPPVAPGAGPGGRGGGMVEGAARAAEPLRDRPGYYGTPIVKPPVWTWEVPLYFFVGGISGMSAVIGASATLFGRDEKLARTAFRAAAVTTPVATALLILDLGRPLRFLNMLRVFKWRSPMSVGSWLLTFYGANVVPAALLAEWHGRTGDRLPQPLRAAYRSSGAVAGLLGAAVATYTGVLISATAIPAWFTHRKLIPVHFGAASLGSAGALLELLGHRRGPLAAIGYLAAAAETAVNAASELDRKGDADRPLREGKSGAMIRGAALLTGPVALGARLLGSTALAAASFLAGSLLSRYGWIEAGRASGRDPAGVLAAWSEDGSPEGDEP